MRKIFDTKKDRINPVLNLPAQTPALWHPGTPANGTGITFLDGLNAKKNLSVLEKAVIEMQFLNGLRIAEVLNIKTYDVSPWGQIAIKTEKTGEPRIVSSILYTNFWIHAGAGTLPIGEIFSRWYFYRLYKKLGYYKKYPGNENNSVTHFFRHELVRNLKASGFDEENISKFLAHRSLKSLAYYVK